MCNLYCVPRDKDQEPGIRPPKPRLTHDWMPHEHSQFVFLTRQEMQPINGGQRLAQTVKLRN